MTNERTWILYDSRAWTGDTEDASVCEASDEPYIKAEYDGAYGGVACYSYARDGQNLVDERHEWNWYPPEAKRPSRFRKKKKAS